VLFPEPWLHVRSGSRSAPWPFRGRFLRVGLGHWQLGPAQKFLVGFIGLSLIYIASELVLFLVIAPARRLVGLCRADFAMASRCGLPLLESGPVAFSVGRDEGSTPRCGD